MRSTLRCISAAARRACFPAQHLSGDALDSALHLGSGAAREGEQHHPAGVDARDDQMGDTVGEGVGLARSCTGNDQEGRSFMRRSAAMLDGAALFGVELRKVGGGDGQETGHAGRFQSRD